MDNSEIQPHIFIGKEQTDAVVLVMGDPQRAMSLAQMCEKHVELAFNREYRSFRCTHKGQNFTVCSHGVGASGASICFEELIKNGAQVIIRCGTAGSLQPQVIKQGDLVVCFAAAREDGMTKHYVPDGFPAVADFGTVQTLITTAKTMNIPVHVGTSLTSDTFYSSPVMPDSLNTYSKAKIDIVEMEIAALFTIAKVRGIKAGAVCAVDGCPLEWDQSYAPHGTIVADSKKAMLKLAIEVASQLSKTYH